MNTITTTENTQVSAETLEDVLANGNLNDLTPEQRVAYYFRVCESLGLNPYTRPFDYITLNGKRVLYAKRDATDQLRQKRNITLAVTDKHIEDELFIVTVRATDAKGRSDEDFGAVPITGLKGEARANAILKGITKAKRRVTLSICGLGMNDESEVVTIPGAITEELLLPPPTPDLRESINDAVPLKAAASDMKRPPKVTETAEEERLRDREMWLQNVEMKYAMARSRAEVMLVGELKSVKAARENGPPEVQERLTELAANAYERFPTDATTWTPDLSDELPEVEIAGADKIAAG